LRGVEVLHVAEVIDPVHCRLVADGAEADSIAGVAGRFVPTARSSTEWWIDLVPAGALSLQQLQIGGSSTFAGDGQSGCFTLGIPMTRAQSIRIDGQRLDANSFIMLKQDQPFTFTGQDVVRWAGVTLPVDHPSLSPELLEKLHASDGACTRTDPLRLEQLRWLIGRICCGNPTIDLLRSAPGVRLVALFSPEHGIRGTADENLGAPWSITQR